MSTQPNANDLLRQLVGWLTNFSQTPPDNLPVLVLVTDPSGQVRQWRLQRLDEAMGLVVTLKQAQIPPQE